MNWPVQIKKLLVNPNSESLYFREELELCYLFIQTSALYVIKSMQEMIQHILTNWVFSRKKFGICSYGLTTTAQEAPH
jgi:hypothetical protein